MRQERGGRKESRITVNQARNLFLYRVRDNILPQLLLGLEFATGIIQVVFVIKYFY
jgi:hypothetical protein